MSQAFRFLKILCFVAAHSDWQSSVYGEYIQSHSIHHTLVSKQSVDIKRIKPCKLSVRKCGARNLLRLLMQVRGLVVLRFKLKLHVRGTISGLKNSYGIS